MEYKIFGCKTNKYFTDRWAESPILAGKEGIFVSSCVVTDKAKTKWVRFVKRSLRILKEGEKVYISGCGSIRDGAVDADFFSVYPEFEVSRDRIELLPEDPEDGETSGWDSRFRGNDDSNLKSRIQSIKNIRASELHTKKFVVIQTGCDNFCTFCLTVQARGRHKSRSEKLILEEIQTFAQSGGQEVVLTGTNLGAWGADSSNDYPSSKFVDLVELILSKTTIPRLRISSLGVEFCDDRMIGLFRQSRINAYVHISIQSGSDKILKSMNRHYDRAKLIEVLSKFRSLERQDGLLLNIGADLIVGFPGETDADFADTLDIVREFGITQLHTFPFSPHKDHYSIPAGGFPEQVLEREKDRRLAELSQVGEEVKAEFLTKNAWKILHVLVERLDGASFQGWSENYIECTEVNFRIADGVKMERGGVCEGKYL